MNLLTISSFCIYPPGWFDPGIDPNAARQPRSSPLWNGWPPCLRISRIGASKWSGTMAITAMSRGGNDRRKESMTPFLASSNRWGKKRRSGGTGHGLFRRSPRSILWSVRSVRGPCGSSAASNTHRSSGTSSNSSAFGSSGPGHHRKSMTRLSAYTKQAGRLPHTSWMTSAVNSPSMTIISIRTLNTPVTNTSRHDAS
jgi:hypothetical protein